MISKTLLLLASGAALAAANNVGEYAGTKVEVLNGEKVPVVFHQWDPTANKKHLGPSQYHHHPPGPSQYHHHPDGGVETHFPKPSDFKPDGNDHPEKHVPATASISRHNPKMTSVPEGHPSQVYPDGNNKDHGKSDHHNGPSATWKPNPGPSQYHHHPGASQTHHKLGASQYHHNAEHKMTPPGEMHYNNGDDKGRTNPKVHHGKLHHGSNATPYLPYVKGNNDTAHWGGHGGASSGGSWVHEGQDKPVHHGKIQPGKPGHGKAHLVGDKDHPVGDKDGKDHNDNKDNKDNKDGKDGKDGKDNKDGKDGKDGDNQEDKDEYKPPVWGPSASARARIQEKQKHDNMYALYGQAAADVCGMDEQMPGAEITACPLENGSGWDCLNLASTLESCGGCMSLGEGQDCTMIHGADTVGCIHGKCVIGSCDVGFYLDSDKGECVANSK